MERAGGSERGVFDGYGRRPTPGETEALAGFAAVDAVSGITFGTTHDDTEVAERGRRTLARLIAGEALL